MNDDVADRVKAVLARYTEIPLDSIEKRRPLNPWKPNHLRSTNFITRYEWREPVPRAAWCGRVGSRPARRLPGCGSTGP